jgi:hypothetical protein
MIATHMGFASRRPDIYSVEPILDPDVVANPPLRRPSGPFALRTLLRMDLTRRRRGTCQGISIWATPVGQTVVDKLAQFKIGAAEPRRRRARAVRCRHHPRLSREATHAHRHAPPPDSA